MTINAQSGRRLGQMVVKFLFAALPDLVRDMAGFATHIQRRVPAPRCGNVKTLRVASQAEVFALTARCRLQQLVLVIADVRIVALKAIANRWGMDFPFQIGGVHAGMAGETEGLRCGGRELNPGDIFGYADFMTAGTAGRNGGVDELPFSFVLVTLNALG